MVVVVPAAGSLETCCGVGGRWANREDEPHPGGVKQDFEDVTDAEIGIVR